jgi:hypothetical protein
MPGKITRTEQDAETGEEHEREIPFKTRCILG